MNRFAGNKQPVRGVRVSARIRSEPVFAMSTRFCSDPGKHIVFVRGLWSRSGAPAASWELRTRRTASQTLYWTDARSRSFTLLHLRPACPSFSPHSFVTAKMKKTTSLSHVFGFPVEAFESSHRIQWNVTQNKLIQSYLKSPRGNHIPGDPD